MYVCMYVCRFQSKFQMYFALDNSKRPVCENAALIFCVSGSPFSSADVTPSRTASRTPSHFFYFRERAQRLCSLPSSSTYCSKFAYERTNGQTPTESEIGRDRGREGESFRSQGGRGKGAASIRLPRFRQLLTKPKWPVNLTKNWPYQTSLVFVGQLPFLIHFWAAPELIFFNTQTMHIEPIEHYFVSLKNSTHWRDSNPGLLFPRRMRCPLRHAARVKLPEH
jgi:hypothetical protein